MYVRLCNRCGRRAKGIFLTYVIGKKYDDFGYVSKQDIHLCKKCEAEFEDWLKGKEFDEKGEM